MTDPKPELAGFHREVHMEDMMETVGVDQFDVVDLDGGQSYIRARANCHACSSKEACSQWLAANREGSPQAFCPNADLLRTVKN